VKTFVDILRARAEARPDRRAFTFLAGDGGEAEVLRYGELDRRARAIAVQLLTTAEPGDRALVLAGGSSFVTTFFGCLYAGIVPVPVPPARRSLRRVLPRLRSVARDCAPRIALHEPEAEEPIAKLSTAAPELAAIRWFVPDAGAAPADAWRPPPIDGGSLLLLQYTSGSTSVPKGVMVHHEHMIATCEDLALGFAHGADDVMVSWLPCFHDMGLVYGTLTPIFVGHEAVAMSPVSFLEQPVSWLRAISKYRGTHTAAPNFAFDMCCDRITEAQRQGLDLASWRVALNGAEPVRQATLDRFTAEFRRFGYRAVTFCPGYGLAEATLKVSAVRAADTAPTLRARRRALEQGRVAPAVDGEAAAVLVSCGTSEIGSRIEVVDPDTAQPCEPGRIGEIWVKGPSIAAGYWNNAEATESVFGGRLASGEGPFLRTGDLGVVDGGQLYVTGRRSDVVILRGRNHFPADIEQSVERSHAAVRGACAAAFAVDDGEREHLAIVAEVDRRPGIRWEDVTAAIEREVAADHEVRPSWIVLLRAATIPKTSSGKVQRAACRSALLERSLATVHEWRAEVQHAPVETPAPAQAWRESAERRLLERIAKALRVAPARIHPSVKVCDLALDSVMGAELTSFLSTQFGIAVRPETFLQQATVREVLDQIFARAPEGQGHARAVVTALPSAPPRARRAPLATPPRADGVAISLLYFADDGAIDDQYDLLLKSARIADERGLSAVWLPERHFHPFGGAYPNPSVAAAAVSMITSRLRVRAGSVVLPLHDPVRVAEEWSLVDNLSGGRVDLAFATGWNPNDFVLHPEAFAERRERTFREIEVVRQLWRGAAVTRNNGVGQPTEVRIYPRPLQSELPIWLTCTGSVEGFIAAGTRGHNVLTALLFQTPEQLAAKIKLYRAARRQAGHDPDAGLVTLMLHAYVDDDVAQARAKVRAPFVRYLSSSVDLWRHGLAKLDELGPAERQEALDFAFERYANRAALFGTPETCGALLEEFFSAGVDEVACLVDFGVDLESVLASVERLATLVPRLRDVNKRRAAP
jgi:natural product biosynthesis luciferase-like monooxygenase protein